MPDEANLGDLLRSADGPVTGKIDADAVIRRARRRRIPRVAGTAIASVLAVGLVAGGGVFGLSRLGGASAGSSASSAIDSSGTVPKADGGTAGAAADSSRCGYPAPGLTPTPNGLVITVDFPASGARGAAVTAVATLTNSGPRRVTGSTGVPVVTLAHNGIVVWHTDTRVPVPLRKVDLAPGASMTFPVVLAPLSCSRGDDASGNLPTGLPPAPAGSYQVSASIVVDGVTSPEQVNGPSENFTIR